MPPQRKQSKELISVVSSKHDKSGSEYQVSEGDDETETDTGIEDDAEDESDGDLEEAAADITAADVEEQVRQFDLAHKGTGLKKPVQANTDRQDDGEELFDGNVHPPEYYRRDMQDLNERAYLKKNYSEGTLEMVNRVERQWTEFSRRIQGVDAIRGYETINFSSVFAFLKWTLNQKKSLDGKLKRGTTKKAFLITFWCNFRLAYQRAMGCKIDQAVNTQMISQGIAELTNVYDLSSEKRNNRAMLLADFILQIDTMLRTTEKDFKIGELRILSVLFLLLMAPAGSRLRSILRLRFGDINILLVRDPKHPEGPYKLLIRFTLAFTKRYLDSKAIKTFMIPEIIYDDTLLLSPHVFLLGILFRHNAFRSESLNKNPGALADLRIWKDDKELLIPLRRDLDEVPLFRRYEETLTGALSKMPKRTPAYRKAAKELSSAKMRLRRSMKARMRAEWGAKQAVQVEDIEIQIQGNGFAASPNDTRKSRPMSSPLRRLVTALTAPLPPQDLAAQFQRRTEAVLAVMAYCEVIERPSSKVIEARPRPPAIELQQQKHADAVELLRRSVFCKPGQRLRRCFICVGKALSLPSDDPNIPDLCHTYAGHRESKRHFISKHLSKLEPNQKVVCPVCIPKKVLKHKDHFRNYAESVHGIRTVAVNGEPTDPRWY
ncbi:hypothetical protein INS49_014369 [Diaporthe citri]|uniref:uncharacterized protein n=1 Tax=Diaporthe citri TaxID=83186 RepID=UPI001C81D978|nr:uncharacterized protein INS49_014369 [Diaporthe citri]KAG6358485.1 hypothetical protein INS49_014369 [Diaporthe citri]